MSNTDILPVNFTSSEQRLEQVYFF